MTKQELDRLEVEAFRALQKAPHKRKHFQNICRELERLAAECRSCGDGKARRGAA